MLAEHPVERGGVGDAGLDGLHHDGLIAENLHADLIALLIEAQMFEPKQHPHPAGAADTVERNFFTAQIFRALDVGPGDEVIAVAAGKSRDDFEIMARADRRQRRAAAAAAELDVPGCHTGDEQRRAAYINLVGLEAVSGEKALLIGDPQWRHPAIHRCVADHDLS